MEHDDVCFFTLKGISYSAAYSEDFANFSVPIYFDTSNISMSVESVNISGSTSILF